MPYEVCPRHKVSPCDCGWKPYQPPFLLFKRYSTKRLADAGALLYRGAAHVLVKAPKPGYQDVVYTFARSGGKWSCEGVGNIYAVAEYVRERQAATPLGGQLHDYAI